ncbi:MAG TPA: hypothetical protein VJB87_03445, partial [Candidatus Nanoarchaeia archaeon]|nr:hypothetical protein [Candidatus Nanoarchaeia archaeon]
MPNLSRSIQNEESMNTRTYLREHPLQNPERFQQRFRLLLFNIKNNPVHYEHLEGKKVYLGDAFLTKKETTLYLVPKEYEDIFDKYIKKDEAPLGFTLLASTEHGLRLCAFGVNIILYEKAVL